MHRIATLLLAVFALVGTASAPPSFNPTPWLQDLVQIRAAIDDRYPNRDWLTGQREVSLDRWFERTADTLRRSRDEYEARRAIERLIERFNDGHMAVRWPTPATAALANPATSTSGSHADGFAFCAARGYDAGQVSVGTAAALPGYTPTGSSHLFNTGTLKANDRILGVLRIGVFSPEGYPEACKQAISKANIPVDKPCDQACDDRLLTEVYAVITRELVAATGRLQGMGAQVLLVDLTRNGGGTDWTEAAARVVSPVPLESARIMVMRSEEMFARWTDLARKLRHEVAAQPSANRASSAQYADSAERIAKDLKPCADAGCSRLVQAGFTTGLLSRRPAGVSGGDAWVSDVFSPAQFPYQESVWKGPVIVLLDDETWSAAEQFAALLRDNDAAIVMGTRTGGAGCGRLYGNNPITLRNSGAKLEMPNCARLRRDGSNEVSGIVPDVPTGVRWNDGPGYAGRLTAARLEEAITRAESQASERNQNPKINVR